jgi:hypothetical protein
MKVKERRLDKLERAAKGDEVRVIVYWGDEERQELEREAPVTNLSWDDQTTEATVFTPARQRR